MSDMGQLTGVTRADKGVRVVAYLIDGLPLFAIVLLWFLPIVGAMVFGLLASLYWLLRDAGGASLGKLAMGLRVAMSDGSEATPGARILRNITLAVPLVGLLIPLAGYVVGPCFIATLDLIEVIALLATGDRLGDRLAGTTVVRK